MNLKEGGEPTGCIEPPDPPAGKPRVLYFASDATDAATRRRMRQIEGEGYDAVGVTFRRIRDHSGFVPPWINMDLGPIADGAYLARLGVLAKAILSILHRRKLLKTTRLAFARNLDMLALAWTARSLGVFKAPIVYDVFDIRGALIDNNIASKVMRFFERILLSNSKLLIVSSDGFIRKYFSYLLNYTGPTLFIENRVDLDLLVDDAVRAHWRSPARAKPAAGVPMTLGWVGALRCERSAMMLRSIAIALPQWKIQISGKPTFCDMQDLLARFSELSNIAYTGEYRFPDGLCDVYSAIDVNWCFDLSKDATGRWLLPNRLYEGGYFGVPQLAETGSEAGDRVAAMGLGWTCPATEGAIIELLREEIPQSYARIKARAIERMDRDFAYDHDLAEVFRIAL